MEIPLETSAQQTQNMDTLILQSRIREMSNHMKFVGLFAVIYGAIATITIIGAIFGIPYLIAGLRLRESAASYKDYAMMNDPRLLITAFEKQSSFFFIMKVLIIIGLVIMAIYMLFLLMFVLGFMGMNLFDQGLPV